MDPRLIEENDAAERSVIARRPRHAGTGWGRQNPVQIR
jgi:hypothetical protein